MDNIECTKQKIRAVIAGSKVPEDSRHAENTLDLLLRFKPDANEVLQIAALGHDIERALETRKVKRADFPEYDIFKSAHARNSAEILRRIMEDCGVPHDTVNEVYVLVCRHETGEVTPGQKDRQQENSNNENLLCINLSSQTLWDSYIYRLSYPWHQKS